MQPSKKGCFRFKKKKRMKALTHVKTTEPVQFTNHGNIIFIPDQLNCQYCIKE